MYRSGWACLLAVAVVSGVWSCSSSEPEPAQESASLRTAGSEVTAASCSSCLDIQLGEYGLFLIEDATLTDSTVVGKVAAGGNLSLVRSTVGPVLPPNAPNALVAGGNLSTSGGTLHGEVRYGGTFTNGGAGCASGCTVTPGLAPDFNFAARRDALYGLSSRLAGQQGLAATVQHGNVKMSGADPCLNVFEVTDTHLTGAWAWSINAPASSFVVVNIRSAQPTANTAFRFNNFSTAFSGGITPQRVLYHFVDATSVAFGGTTFKGTLLAPRAQVTFTGGQLSGGVYAASLKLSSLGTHSQPLDALGGECEEGTEVSCATSCGSTGTRVCGATCSWGACTPPAEACNGEDDTCDGQVDEGFECTGVGSRSCTAWCGAAGTQSCNPTTCAYEECASASCCRADADCANGSYCEGNTCAVQRVNGASCSSANQCASGNCVDGVCCDSSCSGSCDACNLAGTAGTCTLLAVSSAGSPSCSPYLCNGSSASCPASCTTDSQCIAGDYCSAGACVPKKPTAATCSAANECASDNCVDGVCCNTACAGACDACNLTGTAGTCSPVASGGSGSPSCSPYVCNGSSSACPTACTADSQCIIGDYCSAGACVPKKPTAATCSATNECASGNCVDGVCCNSSCSGSCDACNLAGKVGTCSPSASGSSGSPSCSPYMCGGSSASCPTACTTDSQCISGNYCAGGACVPKKLDAATCSATNQCASGNCVDGVFCNSSCNGACDACNLAGKVGTCSPSASGSPGSPSCSPFVCGGSSSSCPASCTTDSQCISSNRCSGGACVPRQQCGDGVISGTEVCDYGNNSPCPYGQCRQCNSSCTGYQYVQGDDYCGDWVTNGPEACDDGNNVLETSCPGGAWTCTVCNANCSASVYINTTPSPPANCPSKTVYWEQERKVAWHNNPKTLGTYYCSGTLSATSHGSTATASHVRGTTPELFRKGSVQYTCDNGNWTQTGTETCDGDPYGVYHVTCASSNPDESMFIDFYRTHLMRCADFGGLNWWTTQGRDANHPCNKAANRRECFRTEFLRGSEDEAVADLGHITPTSESFQCGAEAASWLGAYQACMPRPGKR